MKRRILVVDDDAAVRDTISQLLEGPEYAVETVGSGYRAMVTVKDDHYDLIMLDIMMPGLNGLETLRHLNELQEGVPVIVITGLTDRAVHERALQAGAVAVLQKPVRAEALFSSVESALTTQ